MQAYIRLDEDVGVDKARNSDFVENQSPKYRKAL
jgi:hypothetical protein